MCNTTLEETKNIAPSRLKNKRAHIVFEDQNFLIASKPAGLLVIPDRFDHEAQNLYHQFLVKYPDLLLVHRIDKNTSGLVCFAKNEKAQKHFSELLMDKKVEKTYHALCHNNPPNETGTIDLFLKEDPTKKGKIIAAKKGKRAISHYTVIKQWEKFSLLEIRIETGRTHQIRVHLKNINCPIVADDKYGISPAFYLSQLKRKKYKYKKDQVERPLIYRHALHAYKLKFKDLSGKYIEVNTEMPKDMKAMQKQLDKFYDI